MSLSDIYYFCSSEQYQPENLIRYAVAAERAGFDGIMISEHFHPWVEDESASGFAFTTLGAIAAKTKSIKLMTAVTAPLYRFHPAIVAQAAATVDRISNGRMCLGVGTGENINEAPLGFSIGDYSDRQARLGEANEIIRRLLSGEKLSFNGKYYQTNSAKLYSPPIGRIPIYMSAGGLKSAMTAGRDYDGLIVSVKDSTQAMNNIVNPALDAAEDKDFKIISLRWSVFGKDEKEAMFALKSQRGLRAPSRDHAVDPLELQKEADKLSVNDILSRYSWAKTIEDYYNIYAPLISEMKSDIVGIQTTSIDQFTTIKLLGKELLPRLRKL